MALLLLACAGTARIESDDKTDDSGPGPADSDSGTSATSGPPPEWAGDGADGPVDATGDIELSALGADVWHVAAVEGADVVVDREVTGLGAGDEVLFLVVQGTRDVHADAGRYLFSTVSAVADETITLAEAPEVDDLDVQTAILQRVPHFTDVEVSGKMAPPTWDGLAGGVLAFRATGTVHVATGGVISADGKGYAGGDTGTVYGNDGFQGSSYTGIGSGDGAGSSYNELNGAWAANGGGGGSSITGGGGNHAGGATDGQMWDAGRVAPEAGESYGEADLSRLFFGSGGGGVWFGEGEPGSGGNGGGILFIAARSIVVDEVAGISARGDGTEAWSEGNWTYGAGGGAGGSVWLVADTLTLVSGAVDASGGSGQSDTERAGGDGGYGRVRVDANSLGGVTLAEGCLPAPEYTGVP